MDSQIAPPQLGHNILIVMDRTSAFLDALHAVASRLPDISSKFFTLLCCYPTVYWEHGGADSPEVKHDIEQVWEFEEERFNRIEQCFERATSILRNAGVPTSHIVTKTAVDEDSLIAATMSELRSNPYTGIIISHIHAEIVNRLRRKGLTDLFRRVPKVEVWAVDVD